MNAELVNKIVRDKLGPEMQIDLDLFRDALDLDILKLEEIGAHAAQPAFLQRHHP